MSDRKPSSGLGGLVLILCGLLATWGLGCEELPTDGECEDDEDLQEVGNYVEGAVCVNGHAACPDGKPVCFYYATNTYGQRIMQRGCKGPCIECPPHYGLCTQDIEGVEEDPLYMCVEKASDCWSSYFYLDLEPPQERCPAQNASCF